MTTARLTARAIVESTRKDSLRIAVLAIVEEEPGITFESMRTQMTGIDQIRIISAVCELRRSKLVRFTRVDEQSPAHYFLTEAGAAELQRIREESRMPKRIPVAPAPVPAKSAFELCMSWAAVLFLVCVLVSVAC